jgi:hypothetical protein
VSVTTALNIAYTMGSYIRPSHFHPFQQFSSILSNCHPFSFIVHLIYLHYVMSIIAWPTVYAVFSVLYCVLCSEGGCGEREVMEKEKGMRDSKLTQMIVTEVYCVM